MPRRSGGKFSATSNRIWKNFSGLDHLIRLTFFVKGPFPDGGVLSSPNFRLDVLDAFFAEHCPKHCSDNNPPPSEVIGVAALAQADIVIEIVAVAALPD